MANLLDRASIVLTPTAYNNGEALCIKPDDGSGDFQFSRNSAATRVNAQGLVENVQILSSNLVQNGDFSELGVEEVSNGSFTNGSTDWSLGNWSVGDNLVLSGATSFLYQLNVLTSTTSIYKTTFRARSVSGASVTLRLYDGSGSYQLFTITSSDFQDFELTRQRGGTNATLYFYNNSDAEIEITNISVKEVGQNWDLGDGWSIGDGVAVATSGAASKLTQSISGLSGKKCSVTFTLSNYGGNGTIKLDFGSVVGQNINANGTYTEVGTYDIDRLEFFKNSSFSGSIDNVSVIEITTDTSLPRINYEGFSYDGSGNVVPDSGCGSWLFEPQSTNLVPYSEDFSQWDVINTPIITSNYGVSPDGTQNADRLQMNTNDRIYTSVPASGNTAFSVYLKGSGIITLRDSTNVYRQDVTLTSEWERYSLYFNATSNTVQIQNQKVGDVDCEIWGAQVEALSYPTSYIPTSGSTVTRNQDVCNNGGSLASINSTEGVLYFEGSALVGGSNTQISLSDGTNDNGVKLRFDLNPDRLTIFLRGNSGTFAIKTITGVTQTDNNKIALVWDITNFRIWINGTEQGLIATNDLPIGLDTLNFANNTGSSNFQGKTKALAVFPYLSDAELTELTTI